MSEDMGRSQHLLTWIGRGQAARRDLRPWRLALSLLLLALVLGLCGLWQYENAAPIFPRAATPGRIVINVPQNDDWEYEPTDVEISLTDPSGVHLTVLIYSRIAAKSRFGSCVPIGVRFSEMPISHLVDRLKDIRQAADTNTAAWARGLDVSEQMCFPNGVGLVVLDVVLEEPLILTRGSVTDVRLPGIELVGGRDASTALAATWEVDMEGMPDDLKPEVVSDAYKGPGLIWAATGTPPNPWRSKVWDAQPHDYPETRYNKLDAQFGTFISISTEKAAARSIFWAGLWAGAAVSILAWAGEVAWKVRARRRNRQQTDREQLAAEVAAQVLKALEERVRSERTATPSRNADKYRKCWSMRILSAVQRKSKNSGVKGGPWYY